MTIYVRGMWEDSGFGWEDHVHEEGANRYCWGGKGGGTTTVKQDIPQWVSDAGTNNYNQAVQISEQPYQQYPGERVAGLTPDSYAVFDRVRAMQGQGQDAAGTAMGMTAATGQYQPQQVQSQFYTPSVQAGSVAGTDLSAYVNPYNQQVLNTGLQALEMQRQQALNKTGDQAAAQMAYGGARQGVAEGVLNANAAMQAGQLAAGIQQQGYTNAQQMAQADINRNLTASTTNAQNIMAAQQLGLQGQTANQSAGINAAQLRLGAANQYGQLANLGQQMQGRELSLLDTIGQQQRGINQAQDDAAQKAWTDAYNWNSGLTGLGLRESTLGMTPYSTGSTSSVSGGGNPLGQAAGGALAGATIAGAMGANSAVGAGLGAAASALSDPKTKKDMKRVGEDEATGLGIFGFRYKDAKPNSPKLMGLDAREVAKKLPEASVVAGGVHGILMDKLPEHLRALVNNDAMPEPVEPPQTPKKRGRR